jgi:hypothetical protein
VAQLGDNDACEQSARVWRKLQELDGVSLRHVFELLRVETAKATKQENLLVAFDAAHRWIYELRGELPSCPGSSEQVSNTLLSAAMEPVRRMHGVQSMWVGKALPLLYTEATEEESGWKRNNKLFLEFPPLRPDDVRQLLQHFLHWDQLDEKLQEQLQQELQGRARLTVVIICILIKGERPVQASSILNALRSHQEYMTSHRRSGTTLAYSWHRALSEEDDYGGHIHQCALTRQSRTHGPPLLTGVRPTATPRDIPAVQLLADWFFGRKQKLTK